jgi:tetratricopeptide (TPR) repeat protein
VDQWYQSERFRQLHALRERGDVAAERRLIDEAIAGTAGQEQAFWYCVRVRFWVTGSICRIDLVLLDLQAAMKAAPGDVSVARVSLWTGLAVAAMSEDVRGIGALRQAVPRHLLPELMQVGLVQYYLGLLQMRRGRWLLAMRAFTAGAEDFTTWPEFRLAPNRRHVWGLRIERARACLRLGQLDEAAADLAAADRLEAKFPPEADEQLVLRIARAEYAFACGRPEEARSLLQIAMCSVRPPGSPHLAWSYLVIQADLLAARIARAGGNREAFRFFGAKALATANASDLLLSVRRAEHLLAGGVW